MAGLWFPDENENIFLKIWYWSFNIITNGYSVGLFMPSEFLAFEDSGKILEDAIKNASVAVTHLLSSIKVIVWLFNRKLILKMISILEKNALQYQAIDDFQPAEILEKEKRVKNYSTAAFLLLANGVSITAFFGATAIFLTDYTKYEEITIDANNVTIYTYTQKLPYWAWMPFDYRSSRLRFFLGILYTCFTPFQQAYVIVGTITVSPILFDDDIYISRFRYHIYRFSQ